MICSKFGSGTIETLLKAARVRCQHQQHHRLVRQVGTSADQRNKVKEEENVSKKGILGAMALGFGALFVAGLCWTRKSCGKTGNSGGAIIRVESSKFSSSTRSLDKICTSGGPTHVQDKDLKTDSVFVSLKSSTYADWFSGKTLLEPWTDHCDIPPRRPNINPDDVDDGPIILLLPPAPPAPRVPVYTNPNLVIHVYPKATNSQLVTASIMIMEPWEISSALASIHRNHPNAVRILINQMARFEIPDEISSDYMVALLESTNEIYEIRGIPILNVDIFAPGNTPRSLMSEINEEVMFYSIVETVREAQLHPWLVQMPLNYLKNFVYHEGQEAGVKRIGDVLAANCGFAESGALRNFRSRTLEAGGVGGDILFLRTLAQYHVNSYALNHRLLLFVLQRTIAANEDLRGLTEIEMEQFVEELVAERESRIGFWKIARKLRDMQYESAGNGLPEQ